MQSVLTEKTEDKRYNEKEEEKREKKNAETEWVLCSEDWRDIVIKYIPYLNNIPIEENYG